MNKLSDEKLEQLNQVLTKMQTENMAARPACEALNVAYSTFQSWKKRASEGGQIPGDETKIIVHDTESDITPLKRKYNKKTPPPPSNGFIQVFAFRTSIAELLQVLR